MRNPISCVVVMDCSLAGAALDQEASRDKKLIEWGWDEPDTKFIRENVQRMEELPFDGLIFHVLSSKGGNLVWEMWGNRRFELAEFRKAYDTIKVKSADWSAVPERYRRHVQAGFGLWMDCRRRISRR